MQIDNPVFIPGPTNMPDVLRRTIDIATMDHRSPAFGEMLHPVREGVKRIFRTTEGETVIFPSTGTGGWEAAISNTLSPGDKVLAARHGMFSHKWIDLCQRHGLNVQIEKRPFGASAPVEAFAEALAADSSHEIKAVLVTHNETATGVRSDVAAVRRAMDDAGHPALLLVDGVSSIASMDFCMDDWGVDIAITGSQKGFMLPPGLAIVCLSPKALAAMEKNEGGRCYFDFNDMLNAYPNGGYPYTPPVGLIKGLGAAIEMLEAEGIDAVHARHHRIAEGIRKGIAAWGLPLCAEDPNSYSDTVSAIVVPEGFDGNAVVSLAALKYNVAFGAGLGDVAGKVFRIGHLGAMSDVMALSGLATAEMVMADLGLPVELGSGVAAAQDFYRHSAQGVDESIKNAA